VSRVRWREAPRPKSAGPSGSGRGAWAGAGQAEGVKARGPRGVGWPRALRERARDAGVAGPWAHAAAQECEQDAGGGGWGWEAKVRGLGWPSGPGRGERVTIGENEGERILGFFFYVPLLFFVYFSSSLYI
jgi:hypothetical protein